MSCGSATPLTRRSAVLLRVIAALPLVTLGPAIAATSTVVAHVAQPATAALRRIDVAGTDDQLVITLHADGPISGRLQQLAGGTTRLFVDLDGVRPQVEALTPVNRGPVLRIRVALHRAQPPVTRVVLDVSNAPPSRVERGDSERELRIIIGGDAGQAVVPPSLTPSVAPTVGAQEKAWCADLVERLTALLEKQTPSTSQPEMLAAVTAWDALEREVSGRQASKALQPVHFSLLQAVRLGRIAATQRNAREFDQANAALAGARLLVATARTKLEGMR